MSTFQGPPLSTQVRCLVDGEVTFLTRAVHVPARQESHAIIGIVTEPARLLGWWLACGHYVDAGAWELRVSLGADEKASGLTWWAPRGSPDGPPPADALVVIP
jgi:hypothetical protein